MNRWQTVEVCDKMLQRVQVSRVFQSVEVCATVSAWAELLFLGVSRPLLTMTKPCHTMLVLDHSITITTATPPQDSRGNPGGEQCERASPGAGSTKPTHWSAPYSLHLRRGEPIVFTCPSVPPHPTVYYTHQQSATAGEYSGGERTPYAPRHPFNPGYCSHYQLGAPLLPSPLLHTVLKTFPLTRTRSIFVPAQQPISLFPVKNAFYSVEYRTTSKAYLWLYKAIITRH